MRRATGAAALVAAAAALCLATGCTTPNRYSQEDLQRDLDAIRNSGTVGVQARVTGPDGEVLTGTSGFGDLDSHAPVPLNGHYRIGSNTKTFVATVVLQLVAEEQLSLDDSVERHLPGVLHGAYDGSAVTVRDLLRHTSGIYDYNDDRNWNPFRSAERFANLHDQHYQAAELVEVAVRHPPRFPPGTEMHYSNTNYVLAGMLIRAVTGNSWPSEVRTRIIEPLGLSGTSIPNGTELPAPHARGYQQFERGGPLVDATHLDPSAGDAGGAIVSTPQDMTRFFQALLGGELLAPTELAAMQDTVPEPGGRYGLGLGWSELTCGGGYWRHGGAVPGWLSAEGFSQDGGRGVVVSLSSLHDDPQRDAEQGAAVSTLVDNVLCAVRGGLGQVPT